MTTYRLASRLLQPSDRAEESGQSALLDRSEPASAETAEVTPSGSARRSEADAQRTGTWGSGAGADSSRSMRLGRHPLPRCREPYMADWQRRDVGGATSFTGIRPARGPLATPVDRQVGDRSRAALVVEHTSEPEYERPLDVSTGASIAPPSPDASRPPPTSSGLDEKTGCRHVVPIVRASPFLGLRSADGRILRHACVVAPQILPLSDPEKAQAI